MRKKKKNEFKFPNRRFINGNDIFSKLKNPKGQIFENIESCSELFKSYNFQM